MMLYCLFMFGFICMTKIASNEKGVNVFDIVVFANLVSLTGSIIFVGVTGKGFVVSKDLRCPLVMRSIVGLCGLTSLTFGAVLVPITV